MSNGFYTFIESKVILDKNISSTSKILYSVICYFSNNEKGYCFKNNSQLMELVNISKRQFYYCLKELKEFNYVEVKKNNNRTYIMPVVNKIYLALEERRKIEKERIKNLNLFDYDWLNERE